MMPPKPLFLVACLTTALGCAPRPAVAPAPRCVGGAVAPGMTLVYWRDGAATPAWTIDSVVHGAEQAGRRGCTRIVRRTSPGGQAETMLLCPAGDTLMAWDARGDRWQPSRPIGPGILIVPRAQGGVVRYEAAAATSDSIDGRRYDVVPTVVTTVDSGGREVRRLRERYAPALATATWGTFEVADSSGVGWTKQLEFELRSVSGGRAERACGG